ncbi:MAG: hypothetical protein IPP08_11460 [Chlorobiota bacterium]|jgi:hypothetical protein|nr:hypothetical protein [Chlorobiota bacterium]QQS66363.1 MAG: hypothetical protein IPP08_11460 [Chlorobiota bacterium]
MKSKLSIVIAVVLLLSLVGWLCNTIKDRSSTLIESDTINHKDPNTSTGNDLQQIDFSKIEKPNPLVQEFNGCPPEGDGGDPKLNILKNRIDESDYIPIPFETLINLTWPIELEKKNRKFWSKENTKEIAKYEGSPIVVEGYLVKAKKSGSESCNCHGALDSDKDFHVWLTQNQDDDRTKSIVIEPTPRVKANKPNWTLSNIGHLILDKTQVRISGWLLLDPEHPDEIGKTRGSIWEIHPVMKIEYKIGNGWKEL